MKVSILAIGTELTDGQTINRNAPWISQKLKAAGVATSLHLIVPDERRLMRQGLELCAAEADVVFVTGGLGPTSDDFTRDIVAEWIGEPLEFHSPSWDHLTARLTTRGYTVKEIQRQQCYFPRGAEVLLNTEGTANAFKVQAFDKTVFVLPGPPREIEAVWENAIAVWLNAVTKNLDPVITRIWDTMGRGESDIATLAEEALQGAELEKGYRVHLPYVEVKITFRKSQELEMKKWVDRLTMALGPYTVLRDGQDAALEFAKRLKNFSSLEIVDQMSGTFLWQRLSLPLREFMETKPWHFSNLSESKKAPSAEVQMTLVPTGDFSARAEFICGPHHFSENLCSPFTTKNMRHRSQQFLAEKALLFWYQSLGQALSPERTSL